MAAQTSSQSADPGRRPPRSFDLRERKRTRTRLMIQAEALRLFADKGYANTTVDEIADAAAISPRTFFRYFPTKEDVVIWDEYDPLALELVQARPDDESPAETARALIRASVEGLYRRDREQLLARARLLASEPALRARALETQESGGEALASVLAQRRRTPLDELRVRMIVTALGAAVAVAMDLWQKDDGKGDLLALLDQAIDTLADGMRELEPSRAARATIKSRARDAKRAS
jgi:AcrR family transcriptional regulator